MRRRRARLPCPREIDTAEEPHEACRFGKFELHPRERRLLDGGVPVVLGSRPFDLLVALVSRAGELLTKDQLIDRVWPGLVVEESNLQVQVSTLRKAIGAKAIATVSGHGYRFELPVERVMPAAPSREAVIPQPLSSLVGREAEIASIRSLLEAHRLVTLKGAGGIGKTRLAVSLGHELARATSRDIWFVDLSAQHDGAALPAAILSAIGASTSPRRSNLEMLQKQLRGRTALLILDNCEQIVESVAATCRTLLESCPGLKLLSTSREPLRITGEAVFTVPPLSEAEAFDLFVARARAVTPAVRDSAEARPLIESIVRRLDGIALAVELAAARVRGMSLKELAAQIDNRFQLLAGGDRTALPRHQALLATMEWSYQLLSLPEQQLFRHLGAFNGPFSLSDVTAVAAGEGVGSAQVIDLLTALVDKSLVQSAQEAHEHCYSLFESTRAFAHGELERSGELGVIQRRHFDHYFDRVRSAGDFRESACPTRRVALRLAYSNGTAALRWSLLEEHDVEGGAAMAAAMIYFWTAFGLYEEGERWLSSASRHLPRLPRLTAARVLNTLGDIYQDVGRFEESERCLRESVSTFTDLGRWRDEGVSACHLLAVTLICRRDVAGALSMLERVLPVFRASGNRRREGQVLVNIGTVHLWRDEPALAEAKYREGADVLRIMGHDHSEALTLAWLSDCEYVRGSAAEAMVTAARALELARQEADSFFVAAIRCRVAKLAAVLGDFPLARTCILESLRIVSTTWHPQGVAECVDECIHQSIMAGNVGDGACLKGFVDHWRGTDPERARYPFRERQYAAVDGKLRELLEPAEYDRQVEMGKRLSVEEAFTLGRAIAESLPG